MMECQDVTKESYPGQAPAFGMGRLSRYLLLGIYYMVKIYPRMGKSFHLGSNTEIIKKAATKLYLQAVGKIEAIVKCVTKI